MSLSQGVALPKCPTLLRIISLEADGREIDRGGLVADRTQVDRLTSAETSPLREEAIKGVAKVLKMHGSQLRFIPAPAADPVIVCA